MVRFPVLYDGAPDWLAMLEGLHQHSDNAMGHDVLLANLFSILEYSQYIDISK